MPSSTAHVATAKPAPYMKQLCRHFGHRNEVSFDDERGEIRLAAGVCVLDATAPGELVLIATAEDAERLEHLEHVIASHLERFGSGDGLSVAFAAG